MSENVLPWNKSVMYERVVLHPTYEMLVHLTGAWNKKPSVKDILLVEYDLYGIDIHCSKCGNNEKIFLTVMAEDYILHIKCESCGFMFSPSLGLIEALASSKRVSIITPEQAVCIYERLGMHVPHILLKALVKPTTIRANERDMKTVAVWLKRHGRTWNSFMGVVASAVRLLSSEEHCDGVVVDLSRDGNIRATYYLHDVYVDPPILKN